MNKKEILSRAYRYQRSTALCGGTQTSPACRSDNSTIEMEMS